MNKLKNEIAARLLRGEAISLYQGCALYDGAEIRFSEAARVGFIMAFVSTARERVIVYRETFAGKQKIAECHRCEVCGKMFVFRKNEVNASICEEIGWTCSECARETEIENARLYEADFRQGGCV
jgi:hypothetical protein